MAGDEQEPTVNIDSSIKQKGPLPPLPPNTLLADGKHSIPKKERVYWDAEEKMWFQRDWKAQRNEERIVARLDGRAYVQANQPKLSPARFILGDIDVCTTGNLTAISAQPKAGKSAAIGGMIASTFANVDKDCLGFVSDNTAGHAVVHFDTEQCPSDHWQLITRAIKRAGIKAAPSWLLSYCVTGFSPTDIREAIRISLDKAAQKFGGIHSFILDGVADAIADVNDPAESNEFVSELHALAIQYDCPIIGVIHVNPGSDKTRGHLGSQLQRKAETNLKLEKDKDEVTVIWSDQNRRVSIPKKSAPCFAWSDEEHMHVAVENPEEAKAEAKSDAKREAMGETAKAVFAEAKNPLSHGELVQRICVIEGLKESGSRRRVEKWLDAGIVTKNNSGHYQLAA